MKHIGHWLLAGWFVAVLASPALGALGSAVADSQGNGVIEVKVTGDPQAVADQITNNLQLTNGAVVDTVTVDKGVAYITFKNASPGSTVEGNLPVDIASAITGPGGDPKPPPDPTLGYVGVGAVLVTGGVLGGLAASGEFSGTQSVSTTSQ